MRSILEQTTKPDEIIVVDDGALEEVPFREECEAEGIHCIYHRKETRGLTASRNAGIRLAAGDVLFFLDDDVVLFDSYIAEILQTYAAEKEPPVMGVGGLIANTKPLTRSKRLRYYLDRLFLVAGPQEGRVLQSGFSTDYGTTNNPVTEVMDVDFLPGGVCSYKKEVFDEFSFSEKYRGYGMGEDKDFSYRVSRRYRLVVNPAAKLYHYESPKMRFDKAQETREIVMGRYNLFRDYVKRTRFDWFFFVYALFGYFLGRVLICCFAPGAANLKRIGGVLMALRDILLGRTAIH